MIGLKRSADLNKLMQKSLTKGRVSDILHIKVYRKTVKFQEVEKAEFSNTYNYI